MAVPKSIQPEATVNSGCDRAAATQMHWIVASRKCNDVHKMSYKKFTTVSTVCETFLSTPFQILLSEEAL
jgi:hypothetical protein